MSTQPRSESPFQNRTLVLVAVLLAVAAFVLNFFYYSRLIREQQRGAFDILAAAADLRADTPLDERDVEFIRVPGVFRDRLQNVIKGEEFRQVRGNTIKRPVARGQVLFWEYLSPDLAESPARLVDPRYRGVTIQIDSATTPLALLRPGGYVDLVGAVKMPDGLPRTMTIIEYVRVLATGSELVLPEAEDQRRRARPGTFRDITLQLRPEDGEKLRAIEAHLEGRRFVVHVRNPADDATRFGKGAFNPDLSALIGNIGATSDGP